MSYNVALVGATGAVGTELIELLEQRNFPVKSLRLLASNRSAGKKLKFGNQTIPVQELTHEAFQGIDVAFFSAGASRSKEFGPSAVKSGAVVIDNSSAFRMDEDVPLVVPEVNPADALEHKGLIANPNCSTIQMVAALKPIHDAAKIKRLVVSTYQSVSGTGTAAIRELDDQAKAYAAGKTIEKKVYPLQILFNVLPHIDTFQENGYTKEEMKMVNETKKIMFAPDMKISATCVRVPVFRAHSESITVETEKKLTAAEATELFKSAEGVVVQDARSDGGYPTPLHVAGTFETYVGRVREDLALDNGLSFWVVADQLYKGAALNAIQIAEYLANQNKL